jgi:hypothetical protein
LDRRVEIGFAREVQHAADRPPVDQVVVVDLVEPLEHRADLVAVAPHDVVLAHQAQVVLDPADELLELELHEPAVGTELDDVPLDLFRDAPDHLGPLDRLGDVAHRHEILDLEGRERTAHRVEPDLVAAEDLQRLVGARQHARNRLERLLRVALADRDDRHLFRDGDDGNVDLARDPFGRAVPRAGLRRRDVGIRNQVHVRPRDPRAVGGEDDRAVHLGQLREPLGCELGVEEETAGADPEHLGPVADEDERSHVGLENPVDALAQGRSRRDQPQRDVERVRSELSQHHLRDDTLRRSWSGASAGP